MNKRILITGAGSGIGKSLLSTLSNGNDHVYGLSRRGVKFDSDKTLQSGENYKCDLTSENDINAFVEFYSNTTEILDAIYLCHGDGLFGKISSLNSDILEKHFYLNVISSILLLQKIFPMLKASEQNPFVCLLSSTAGKIGFTESTAYCASKHAAAGLAKSLREEWKNDGIRVFTVYPGAVSTDIWNERVGFDKKDMIAPEDFAIFLESFLSLPASINLDESYILPRKGIL